MRSNPSLLHHVRNLALSRELGFVFLLNHFLHLVDPHFRILPGVSQVFLLGTV